MIEINDLITLNDNKKYVVMSKTNFNNYIYIFIIEENNTNNYKILKVENENNSVKMTIVKNTKILAKLSVTFLKQLNEKMNQK